MMWMSFGVLDVAWVTSSLLSVMPNLRQCCLPKSCRQPGRQHSALRMPWGAGSHPKSLLRVGALMLASLDRAVPASHPAAGNWEATGPAPFAKATAPAPPGQSRAGSAERRPNPLFQLLPFPSVLPLVFHGKDSAGFSCRSLGAGLAKGGPHAGRAPSLPCSSRRVL